MESSRKNPRRGTTATVSYAEDGGEDNDPMEVDEMFEEDNNGENPTSTDDDLDADEEEEGGRRRSSRSRRTRFSSTDGAAAAASKENMAVSERRTSSRANKFQSSMKEPSDKSIRDLFKETNGSKTTTELPDNNEKPKKQVQRSAKRSSAKPNQQWKSSKQVVVESPTHKSPARRHRQHRLSISHHKPKGSDSESDDSSVEAEDLDDDDEAEEEEEPFKVQRIIASRTEPRNKWAKICAKMNTTEIDYGSRWVQETVDENDDTFEERFLVKWADLSYLHISWETESDLLEQVEGAKTYLTTFFRKSENGFLFSSDERCDGDYFDPAWTQIDRILEVHFPEECPCRSVKDEDAVTNEDLGIILDKNHPDFENGLGREFLIKWGNSGYTEATFEFERDLILNEREYKDALNDYNHRTKKVSSHFGTYVCLCCHMLF